MKYFLLLSLLISTIASHAQIGNWSVTTRKPDSAFVAVKMEVSNSSVKYFQLTDSGTRVEVVYPYTIQGYLKQRRRWNDTTRNYVMDIVEHLNADKKPLPDNIVIWKTTPIK